MKYFTVLLLALTLMGCNWKDEIAALDAMEDKERVWIFAQFNVREEEDGLESYYYYGEVSKNLYGAISTNTINNGFVLLKNVKFWGDDDLIYDYKDYERSGEVIFRIEDIVKITLVNNEPITGKGLEQFETESEITEMESTETENTETEISQVQESFPSE